MKIIFANDKSKKELEYPKWIHPVIIQVLKERDGVNWHQLGLIEYRKYAIVPVYQDESGVYYEKGGRKGIQITRYAVNESRFRNPKLVEPGVNYLFYNAPFISKEKEFTEYVFELTDQSPEYLERVGKLLSRGQFALNLK